jgi:cell division protein FtsB
METIFAILKFTPMGLLDSLFQNDTMKNLAFGTVKKMLVENNYKFLVIKMDNGGELMMDTYSADQEPVIMSQKQIADLENVIKGMNDSADRLERQINQLLDENAMLLKKCSETPESLIRDNSALQALVETLHKKNNEESKEVIALREDNSRLVEMCREQERSITELMKPGNIAVQQAYYVGRADGVTGADRFNELVKMPDNEPNT